MSSRRPLLALILAIPLVIAGARPIRADDAAFSFSKTNNPTGAWSYGYTPTRGGTFALFAGHGTDGAGLDYWQAGAGLAQVAHNGTGIGKLVGGTTYTPAGGLNLTPGNDASWAVVRWTAPAAGTYAINAHYLPRVLPSSAFGMAEVALIHSGAVVFDRCIAQQLGLGTVAVAITLTLTAGETIDMVAGPGDDQAGNDVIGLDATIDVVTPLPSAAGPVFTFGGQRFAAARWDAAFESIAFDASNRRIASKNFIRDLCGNPISAGPDEQPGLAWDSRTGTYWQITNDRVVRRWTAAGALLDTVFAIPLAFSVPGTGPDTLQSVRGIATDSNFVYVVDAGPSPGDVGSNEWIKFTRAGAPVKSSKSTDFTSHLGPGNDAIVDDIVYVPFASPVLTGKLVIALEHTGLQAIDTDGNFVEAFRWADQGFATRPIAALAGVTVDPLNGNFYLVNNDNNAVLVLTRIAPQGAASYLVGGVGGIGSAITGVLKYPNPGCDLPLWNAWGTYPAIPSNFFGYAYRPVDHAVYACEYGTGDMWRFDPRMGAMQRVGPTGVGGWGLAYDSDRDVLYGMVGFTPSHVVSIDPSSGAASTLPGPIGFNVAGNSDIAWDSNDKKIYVVDLSTSPNHLIRIDRDTGVGTIVSNITGVRGGLDYDASIDRLISVGNSSNQLIAIDPATGTTSVLASLPAANGFEGLAVIPIPPNPSVVAVGDTHAPPTHELTAFPNPSQGSTALAFDVPTPQNVTVGVYDVAGRRVRQIIASRFMVGAQRVMWDGRDEDGHAAASGVYFARIESGSLTRVARIVVAR